MLTVCVEIKLEFFTSERFVNLDIEDQECIRQAFGFSKKALERASRDKQKVDESLNNFITRASGGRESLNGIKRRMEKRRRIKTKNKGV